MQIPVQPLASSHNAGQMKEQPAKFRPPGLRADVMLSRKNVIDVCSFSFPAMPYGDLLGWRRGTSTPFEVDLGSSSAFVSRLCVT